MAVLVWDPYKDNPVLGASGEYLIRNVNALHSLSLGMNGHESEATLGSVPFGKLAGNEGKWRLLPIYVQ